MAREIDLQTKRSGSAVSELDAGWRESDLEVGCVPEGSSSLGLWDLPESCIAVILSLTTPKDVARMACICRVFREAGYSDAVWEAMLPRSYRDILAKATVPPSPSKISSKKAIYDYLCKGVLLEDGTQEFWLDRATGGVCRSVGARGLNITWGDNDSYWEWLYSPASRFSETAYLKQVCWFEVRGELNCFLPPGRYTFSWRICFLPSSHSTKRRISRPAYGWDRSPVTFSLETTCSEMVQIIRMLCLEEQKQQELRRRGQSMIFYSDAAMTEEVECIELDDDVIIEEIHVGEFVVDSDDTHAVQIQFSMAEITSGNWKGGVFLDGIVIRPSKAKRKNTLDSRHLSIRECT